MFETVLFAAEAGTVKIGSLLLFLVTFLIFFLIPLLVLKSRYKKCPPNQVMVIYGKTTSENKVWIVRNGAAFIYPVFQDYGFLSLRPLNFKGELENVACSHNEKLNVSFSFTVGIEAENEKSLLNAAERLLGMKENEIADLSREMIIGQIYRVFSTMTIEEIKENRDALLSKIENAASEKLKPLGLKLFYANVDTPGFE